MFHVRGEPGLGKPGPPSALTPGCGALASESQAQPRPTSGEGARERGRSEAGRPGGSLTANFGARVPKALFNSVLVVSRSVGFKGHENIRRLNVRLNRRPAPERLKPGA